MEKAAINIITNQKCTGCFACFNKCPFDAITMIVDDEGFYKPIIDAEKCTNCGLCSKVCPVINYKVESTDNDECFSAYSLDDEILKESSSGGIFTELAKKVLEEGGVVIGVAMIGTRPEHVIINSIEDLKKLRGSKYLPSNAGTIYTDAAKLVKEKKVLFSGTPCQIAAMKLFVKSDNLITVDIVCHGVPSLTVFEKSLTDRFDKKPDRIEFRNKEFGWNKFSMKYFFNEKNVINTLDKDEWFTGYLKNVFLMESCYNCKFNLRKRPGDISLADYWGISRIDQNFYKDNSDKGVSLVIINSEIGKKLYSEVQNKITSKLQSVGTAEKYNSKINSDKYPEFYLNERKKFFKNSASVDFKKGPFVDSKYKIIIKKIKSKISKMIRG